MIISRLIVAYKTFTNNQFFEVAIVKNIGPSQYEERNSRPKPSIMEKTIKLFVELSSNHVSSLEVKCLSATPPKQYEPFIEQKTDQTGEVKVKSKNQESKQVCLF